MNSDQILDIITTGETSTVQFKEKLTSTDGIAAEMIAFANAKGGVILFGVSDKSGEIKGLSDDEIKSYNSTLGNIATELVNPSIFITLEVVKLSPSENGKVIAVSVTEGINKPYKDNKGAIWTKQGADKRRVTENAEILRFFQKNTGLLVDEMEVFDSSIEDVDKIKFEAYFVKEFNATYESKGLTYEQALKAKKVLRNQKMTIAGLLFFGKVPQSFKPAFTVKAVSFFGDSLAGNSYRSKPEDFVGTIPELYYQSLLFLKSSLRAIQRQEGFNSKGVLEISEIALIEILQNALIHRDYLKNAPIRILIFDNRVEIISPGALPNSLTVEEIKYGNPVVRNNQIAAFASHTLPYSGLGSGIKRSIAEQPNIEFKNDTSGEQFTVTFPRPTIENKYS